MRSARPFARPTRIAIRACTLAVLSVLSVCLCSLAVSHLRLSKTDYLLVEGD
jgi:hypothetical protein